MMLISNIILLIIDALLGLYLWMMLGKGTDDKLLRWKWTFPEWKGRKVNQDVAGFGAITTDVYHVLMADSLNNKSMAICNYECLP
jgi:hypothetical protein